MKQFLLLENIWIHTSSILDIDLQSLLGNIHLSKLLFRNKSSLLYKHRRTINPINLQIPIKEVFYAFLKRVKEDNLTLENQKYSPNALEELEQYIHNFEVDDIERKIKAQNNPHHWLQADILRIQKILYHFFKDITLNAQLKPQTKLISLFLRKYFRFNYQLLWSEQDQPAFAAFHTMFTIHH